MPGDNQNWCSIWADRVGEPLLCCISCNSAFPACPVHRGVLVTRRDTCVKALRATMAPSWAPAPAAA